ncbi:MAG: C25 family cysteine peptidase [candidate division Zixibacteria bacterium]|nr:C25 family cysteine peptidase [candidate division Zixibacteria bacterium]
MASQSSVKGALRTGGVCILVNDLLLSGLQSSLDQYTADLTAEGYSVTIYGMSGGTPEELRTFLQEEYEKGMTGVVLIGDLPVAWYEAECWDPVEHEEFPADLYYMDMDGAWEDSDSDGLYDTHTGNIVPEIWLGRLTAGPLAADLDGEIAMLQNYFRKNHLYRTGQAPLQNRALVYIDDDWEPWAAEWGGNVGLTYADRTQVSIPDTTIADDYESRLPLNYEAILLCVHSSPTLHAFKIPPDVWHSYTQYYEIPAIDPAAYFYNLFACSNARFVESNYMAGWYIFCDTYGLASIGSAKTGSMLEFGDFYGPFGSGRTYGEALADWFSAMLGDGVEDWERCWYYGMTLCGDPTLGRRPLALSITSTTLPDGEYGKPYSGVLSADGGQPPYIWRLVNDSKLPDGLAFDSINAAITGNPIEVGDFDLEIAVVDAAVTPSADTAQFTIGISFLCGDANNDGQVNIGDAIYLISYIFRGGPPPLPPEAGNVNGDSKLNVADAVYLISYIFRGGPPPTCP